MTHVFKFFLSLTAIAASTVLAIPVAGQTLEITELNSKPDTFSKLNLEGSKANQTLTVSNPKPTQIELDYELLAKLDDGREYRFGRVIRASANTNPDLAFTGTFASLPDHYSGNAVFILRSISAASTTRMWTSKAFAFKVDLVPPRVASVRTIGDEYGANAIDVTFSEENLKSDYDHGLFSAKQLPKSNELIDPSITKLSVSGQTVNIPIAYTTGTIKFSIEDGFEDEAGNKLVRHEQIIAAIGQKPSGLAVDFPPNVVPREAGRHTDSNLIRPSSRVVTKVVKLYYYRDADRVAEIINRRTQQENLANVRLKQGQASQAAEQAADATDQRRQAQRVAEEAAKRTREKERELSDLQITAEEAQQVLQGISGYPDNALVGRASDGRVTIIPSGTTTINTSGLITVGSFKSQLEETIKSFNQLSSDVESLRREEQDLNNQARALEDKESRLVRTQFLRELDASLEDPNTYAAADIDSVDPVMQTSVSVIGEGTIQLRGPIDGINQIRRMIHQIDTPVGQVKVEMETVQLNGEKGPELEKSVQLVEGYINAGRFLTSQSLVLLSRSVSEIAAEIAQENNDSWQRDQQGRDMRYLYGFFGQDFIDTLYRMDSEFLHTENQILSLHSMDAISRNRCLLLIGLAKNSARQRILERFHQHIQGTLPPMEYQYRIVNKAIPCKYLPGCIEEHKQKLHSFMHPNQPECPPYCLEMTMQDAQENYRFLNFTNFFAQGEWSDATLNPIQREYIRLAQIYKSQLIAEIELKQRIVERGLMDQKLTEDKKTGEEGLAEARNEASRQKNELLAKCNLATGEVADTVVQVVTTVQQLRNNLEQYRLQYQILQATLIKVTGDATSQNKPIDLNELKEAVKVAEQVTFDIEPKMLRSQASVASLESLRCILNRESIQRAFRTIKDSANVDSLHKEFSDLKKTGSVKVALPKDSAVDKEQKYVDVPFNDQLSQDLHDLEVEVAHFITTIETTNSYVTSQYDHILQTLETYQQDWKPIFLVLRELEQFIPTSAADWRCRHHNAESSIRSMVVASISLKATQQFLDKNRLSLPQLKLLDHLIDEHQEKSMDLLEGTRAHISAIDNFLKRMTFAMEDDFQIQFYDPSLVCIRTATRGKQVTFSQVERTTVLGNNRDLLKVLPQATMEFDLPKRNLRVTEAMQGAKALVDDYGALLNDPTFLSAYQLMGGNGAAQSVRNALPPLPTQNSQEFHALPNTQSGDQLGASLQSLVPDPEIYQIESGTGLEIRPVIQPDGDSLVYDLNYMYTTELREPVRADEKHLGRVKRHLIHTQVQTSSFELREVGRYQVALKVARTARGVPMLENAPVVGALFRPAPNEESSIQQNIILAKSVVYPTLYDLMGLGWAQHVAELSYDGIRNAGHISRGRQRIVQQQVFDASSSNVDDFLQIEENDLKHRPDLYREHSVPSPYHPNGFVYPKVYDDQDPTRRGFRLEDHRPDAYKSGEATGAEAVEFDDRFRLPVQRNPRTSFPAEMPMHGTSSLNEYEADDLNGYPVGPVLDGHTPSIMNDEGTAPYFEEDCTIPMSSTVRPLRRPVPLPAVRSAQPSAVMPASYRN